MKRWFLIACLFGALSSAAAAQQAAIVAEVRTAIGRNDLDGAAQLVERFRREQGTTSEALEALSWVSRGAFAAGDNERARRVAQQTRQLAEEMLRGRTLDADAHLPIAMGAAIETEAKAMAATGQRASAVLFLQQQMAKYKSSTIRGRLQKNINLLSLEGQPAPALTATEHLGAPMPKTAGRPVVLFFWAHWCPDCKAQAPIVAALLNDYKSQGLIVVGPTRRYGFATRGEDVSPAQELTHIESVRRQYYGAIADMAVPVSDEDALGYGMDATPTLVLVDRQGRVALYHPGKMTREELEPYIKKLVAPL